jgi:hypothetical protein
VEVGYRSRSGQWKVTDHAQKELIVETLTRSAPEILERTSDRKELGEGEILILCEATAESAILI